MILQMLGALTLMLPSDEGENILLAATPILAMYVMQQVLAGLIPQFRTNEQPNLVTALMAGFWLLAFSHIECILVQTMRIVAPDLVDLLPRFCQWIKAPSPELAPEVVSTTHMSSSVTSLEMRSVEESEITPEIGYTPETGGTQSRQNPGTNVQRDDNRDVASYLRDLIGHVEQLVVVEKRKEAAQLLYMRRVEAARLQRMRKSGSAPSGSSRNSRVAVAQS